MVLIPKGHSFFLDFLFSMIFSAAERRCKGLF